MSSDTFSIRFMYGANRTGLKFNLVFDFYVLINTSEIEHKDFKDG